MSRIRTHKPEFWQHPKVTAVSRDARLCFLGLWNESDDEGRMRYSAKRLAGVLFGEDDDVSPRKFDRWIKELEGVGLVLRYEIDGAPLLAIPGFVEHQRISHPAPSRLPPPLPADSANAPRTLREPASREGKGREGKGEARNSAPNARGSRIPNEFVVTDDMTEWARRECPLVNMQRETQQFVDYWKSATGAKATKLDWQRTWQTWFRREQQKQERLERPRRRT